jgi:hypothetical protein
MSTLRKSFPTRDECSRKLASASEGSPVSGRKAGALKKTALLKVVIRRLKRMRLLLIVISTYVSC